MQISFLLPKCLWNVMFKTLQVLIYRKISPPLRFLFYFIIFILRCCQNFMYYQNFQKWRSRATWEFYPLNWLWVILSLELHNKLLVTVRKLTTWTNPELTPNATCIWASGRVDHVAFMWTPLPDGYFCERRFKKASGTTIQRQTLYKNFFSFHTNI